MSQTYSHRKHAPLATTGTMLPEDPTPLPGTTTEVGPTTPLTSAELPRWIDHPLVDSQAMFRLPRLPRPLHGRGLHTAGPPLHHRAPPRADRRREQPSHPTPGDPFAGAAHPAVHRPGVRTLPLGPRRVSVQMVQRPLAGHLHQPEENKGLAPR